MSFLILYIHLHHIENNQLVSIHEVTMVYIPTVVSAEFVVSVFTTGVYILS